jgi:hypothetical protein
MVGVQGGSERPSFAGGTVAAVIAHTTSGQIDVFANLVIALSNLCLLNTQKEGRKDERKHAHYYQKRLIMKKKKSFFDCAIRGVLMNCG